MANGDDRPRGGGISFGGKQRSKRSKWKVFMFFGAKERSNWKVFILWREALSRQTGRAVGGSMQEGSTLAIIIISCG